MSEWISVEDELPEYMKEVLIKEEYVDEVQIGYLFRNGSWTEQHENHTCHGDAYCSFDIQGVTHWMPLPEPPTSK